MTQRIDVMLSLEASCLNLLLCLLGHLSNTVINREVGVVLPDLIALFHICIGLMIERQFTTQRLPVLGRAVMLSSQKVNEGNGQGSRGEINAPQGVSISLKTYAKR